MRMPSFGACNVLYFLFSYKFRVCCVSSFVLFFVCLVSLTNNKRLTLFAKQIRSGEFLLLLALFLCLPLFVLFFCLCSSSGQSVAFKQITHLFTWTTKLAKYNGKMKASAYPLPRTLYIHFVCASASAANPMALHARSLLKGQNNGLYYCNLFLKRMLNEVYACAHRLMTCSAQMFVAGWLYLNCAKSPTTG